jgi:acetyl-CoA C-acetyltransferase
MPSPARTLTEDVAHPRTPVVVAARRTPVGTARGALRTLDVVGLAAPVLRALVTDLREASIGVPELGVDDVVLGNCMGPGGNVARISALAAGLGDEVPGAVAAVLASAGRFEPSAAAGGLELRREWYETTRAAAAVRGAWGSG